MKIPKEFQLFGETIKVIYDDEYCLRLDVMAEAVPMKNKIYLSRTAKDADHEIVKIAPEKIERNFCHELIHFFFNKIAHGDLYNNDPLVERMAGVLHQYLKQNA